MSNLKLLMSILVLVNLLIVIGCSKDNAGSASAPQAASQQQAVTISGIDSAQVIQDLQNKIPTRAKLPQVGDSKTMNYSGVMDPSLYPSLYCRYSEILVAKVTDVDAQSYTSSVTTHTTPASGNNPNCPSNIDKTSTKIRTLTDLNKAFVALTNGPLINVKLLAQDSTYSKNLQSIGITSSSEDTFCPDQACATPLAVQKIVIDTVWLNGATTQNTIEISLDSWFLGLVESEELVNQSNYDVENYLQAWSLAGLSRYLSNP